MKIDDQRIVVLCQLHHGATDFLNLGDGRLGLGRRLESFGRRGFGGSRSGRLGRWRRLGLVGFGHGDRLGIAAGQFVLGNQFAEGGRILIPRLLGGHGLERRDDLLLDLFRFGLDAGGLELVLIQ